MHKTLLKYLDIVYFIKLFLGFTILYSFNIFYWGLTDPKNYYIHFLDNYLNYIAWFKLSILYLAKTITCFIGLNADIYPPEVIKTERGASVTLTFTCLGFSIISFWVAFIIANYGTWQKKIIWGLEGVFFIWFINSCRIALLLVSLEYKWEKLYYIDHHDLYNIVIYLFMLIMIYLRSKENYNAPSHLN